MHGGGRAVGRGCFIARWRTLTRRLRLIGRNAPLLNPCLSCAACCSQGAYVGTGAYDKNIAMSMAIDMVAYEEALAERKAR